MSALEDAVMAGLVRHGGLTPGEVVTHFDLVAETRAVDDAGVEQIRRHHWSPVGSNPHLSYGVLFAEAQRILRTISADR